MTHNAENDAPRKRWLDDRSYEIGNEAFEAFEDGRLSWSDLVSDDEGVCPACGGEEWSTYSDGQGDAASTAAVCVSCRYVTTATVDLGSTRVIPPDSTKEKP